MKANDVDETLAAAEAWLFAQDAPESSIARAERGRPESVPGETGRWIRRILAGQGQDGSWDGQLAATAIALLTIRELQEAREVREQDPGIDQALGWLEGRRGIPGAWTDGCSPTRHQLGTCHHFMGGFFSPAPPEASRIEAVLPTGGAASSPAEARFLASATALRCFLEWRESPGTDSLLHLQGLRHVVRHWSVDSVPELGTTALLAAVHALLGSTEPADRDAAEHGLGVVAGRQRGDGSWVGTDPFHALDVFLVAEAAGVCARACHQAIWHGTRLLISTQNANGTWGADSAARRVLIACRALRSVDPPE
jgi:hypothetical protein